MRSDVLGVGVAATGFGVEGGVAFGLGLGEDMAVGVDSGVVRM